MSNKIGSSLKWSSAGELIAKLIVPITNMILARILVPEDFGILASINMIVSFVDLFTDSGFAKYIIQSNFDDDETLYQYANVAFWTNLGISCFFWIIIVIFRDFIAELVGNPGYSNVIAVAALQLLISSFSSIQTAIYKRTFDFKTLFVTRIVTAVVPLLVTVPVAFISKSYWSLVIGSLASAFLTALVLMLRSNWKPFLYYSIDKLKKMFSFSVWSLSEAVAYWLTNWVDVFIIGATFSAYYLGLYKYSLNMVNSLMALIKSSIIPVLFSSLSRLKQSDREFQDVYFRIQRLTACLLIPAGVGLFVYRDFAAAVMFGSGWEEASDIVGAWALASCFFILFEGFNGEAYKAKGMPKVLFIFQIVYLVIMVPICIYAKSIGFWQMVYARSASILIEVVLGFFFMKRYIGFSINRMIKNTLSPFFAAVVMGLVGIALRRLSTSYIWQFASIIICAAIYFVILFLAFGKILKPDLRVFKNNYDFK